MEKMSLERFLEIKNRIAEIVEIFLEVAAGKEIEDERAEALEQELEEISNEIHNSDLSDIPAESYDGLIDIEFDFEGTKAKLNFDIINESYRQNPLRAKGCEITNFHFDTIAFDEDSFDEEFIEQHKENFWGLSEGQNYPKEVRARYYLKKLTIDDIIQYDLYQKVSEERFDWQAKSLLKAFTIELIGKIDIKLYQMFSFYFHEHQSQLEIEKVSTKEEFDQIMREALVQVMKKGYSLEEDYYKIEISRDGRSYVPEYMIDFPEEGDLREKALRKRLRFSDIKQNLVIFRTKKFMHFVNFDRENITEEQLIYLFDHFSEFVDDIIEMPDYVEKIAAQIDVQKSLEENTTDGFYFELIQEALKQKIKQSFLKDLEQEDAELYLEEIVRFQPRFLEKIRFNHDFENPTRELIRVMIENRLANKIIDGELGYEEYDFDEEFKQSHPELFLDKDAPQELKDRYYSVMTANSFKLDDLLNPEYQKYLIGKEFPRAESALRRLRDMFSVEEIIEFGKIDKEALKIYGVSSDEGVARLAFMLEKFPDKKEEIISMPGLILYGPEELTETHFREYKNLQENNALKNAMPSREDITVRQIYEQILAHMYGFLGFDQAKKLLEEPDIDPESLNQIYEIDGRIKDLYEKKFEITGNIKLLTMLLNGMPGLLPGAEKLTSKANLNLFKALNEQITEEYQGDVRGLLAECLARTGQPENLDAIDALAKRIIQLETEMKLDKLREYTSARVEVDILENAKTRKRIKEIYRDAIKYSLNLSENVDIALVREYLSKEFSRTKESGEPFYSPHVTEHLEDLIHITEELLQNPEKAKIANKTLIDCLKEEKAKIGNRWLMKIASAYNAPEKMTYEEAVSLDEMIYGKDSEHEVETEETVGIKVLTDEEKRRIYEILGNTQYANVLTFNKAEIMFSALTPPYSEEFKEFFLAHKAEFIQNPEYYTIFTKAHRKFEEIIRDTGIRTRYDEGLFTLKDLVNEVNKITYTNVRPGEHELEYWARKAGLTPEQFQIAQKLYEEMKKREEITIPPEQYTGKRYRGRIVRIDDPLHLVIGEITNCCQTIGENDPGESSMIHSATERNGSLFVVEEINENGEPIRIVAQSWTWRNGNRVTFDNVEIPSSVRAELEAIGGFDEIMEVYEGAASQMIQTDRLALQKLLKSGRITQEQYRQMLIKDIAMGKGCDDLIRGVSNEMRKNHPNLAQPSVLPLEIDKRYTGATEKNLYTDARSTILIAHNPDFEQDDHKAQFLEVADLGLKYTKTRDIFHRTGTDIDSDKIETIKALLQRNGRLESSILKDAKFIQDIFYKLVPYGYRRDEIDLDIYRVAMSESGDWFIFTEEQDGGIFVHESGLDTEFPENASEKEKLDRKMALAEYTKEMLEMMQRAADSHKKVMIDAEREGKFLTLNSLVENGEIELSEDGVITILDGEKLNQRIEQLNKVIEESRKDRSIADIGEER